jgi:hypothetical protein
MTRTEPSSTGSRVSHAVVLLIAIGHPGRGCPLRSRNARTDPSVREIETTKVPSGPGAIRIRSPIARADPRTGSAADACGGSDGGAVESTKGPDVGEAEVDASGAGDAGVVTGVGLVADPQAPRSSDTTITAAIAI